MYTHTHIYIYNIHTHVCGTKKLNVSVLPQLLGGKLPNPATHSRTTYFGLATERLSMRQTTHPRFKMCTMSLSIYRYFLICRRTVQWCTLWHTLRICNNLKKVRQMDPTGPNWSTIHLGPARASEQLEQFHLALSLRQR